MKFKDGVIFVGALVFGLGMASAANACSTALWSAGTVGLDTTLFADSPPAFARYAQKCALKVTGDGSVRDLSPDHTRLRVRFYVLTKSAFAGTGLTGATGTVVLFRAYSDETDTTTLFEIKRVDGNLVFNAAGAGGTSNKTVAAAVNGWTSIEFDWTSGGNMDIWVNAASSGTKTDTITAGTGTVKSVRLGAIGGLVTFAGNVLFDAYEAHSTTPVGLLVDGDSNASGTVNSGDTVGVLNEFLGGVLAVGTPDCNRDSKVNSGDTVCIVNKYLGS